MNRMSTEQEELIVAMDAAEEAGFDIVPGGSQGGVVAKYRRERSASSAGQRARKRVHYLVRAEQEDCAA